MNVSRSPATGRMRITGHFPKPEAKVRCNIPKKPECPKKIRHVHPFTERCFLLSAKEELASYQIAYPFFSYKNISRSKSVSVHTLDETVRMNRMQEQPGSGRLLTEGVDDQGKVAERRLMNG